MGARAELHGEDPEAPPHPSRSSSASKKSPAGACQHLCLRSLAGRAWWSGTSWRISASLHRWCRSSIFLCRRRSRLRDGRLAADAGSPDWRAGSSKCPRYPVLHVLLVLLFLSRSPRNSWWKCPPCCLPPASPCGSRSRSSTLQFLVVVVKVFSQNRVQQRFLLSNAFPSRLSSRSLTFLLLVVALAHGSSSSAGPADEDFTGVFRTFPHGKKCGVPGRW